MQEIKKTQFINLHNFEKLETIEKSEYGDIYRIEEKSTGKTYAAFIPENIYANKSNISREIEILQLDHPSICKLVGFCPFDLDNNRRPVIICPYYPNRSLRKILDLNRKQPQLEPWTNTKKLINIYGVASAMSFLHSHQIIHKNLNPTNILEDEHLYPQITKFSVTQDGDNQSSLSNFALNLFDKKPIYMAPELFNNNSFSFASDVYSFSYVVYEIFTSEVPFEKLKAMDILIKVAKQSYRPDIANKQNIPNFFKKLITDCWSQDPNNRPTFDQIIDLLKDKSNYINEFQIDETEFFNYVNHLDEYLKKPELKDQLNFSEQDIEKVHLFKEVEREPVSFNFDLTDLSNFKQLGRIGEGTFGTVYEVINFENGKKYACKVFKNKFYKNFENNLKINNLKNELAILKNMNHPAIVKFIGFNSIDFNNSPNPVILTELAVNRSLDAVLQLEKNHLASEFWTDTKKLINIYGIASSMCHLHSHNIIHRNLKPSNILIDELIHPKLADFSFSLILDSPNKGQDPPFLLGTYDYIAPETYLNKEYFKSSDVYAYSLIVYEIMTNEKPDFGSSIYQVLTNVTNGFRPPIDDKVPECYKKLIQQCWSADPNERPSFEDILKKLRSDKGFITESIKKDEFYEYVHKIDKNQSNFDHKILQLIDYESIYQKQKVVLITDGILNLQNFKKKERILLDNYSNTYKVVEKGRNKVYSAKESNIEINNLCKEEIENLLKDASLLSSINHPYVLKFVGYSSVNFNNVRKPVIVCEYASNRTLEDLIDMERDGIFIEGWNDTKKLINIFGIAYCMSFLHSHDIIHYKLKPCNIVIDENFHPKISGFGFYKQNLIKKCLQLQSVYNPKENFVYETPEVLNKNKYTKESDVYSFAFLVYELITNEKPFADSEQTKIQLLNHIKEEDSVRPKINPLTPDCYKELIESCWSQNPLDRPSFEKIVSILKKDPRFITDKINKEEYFEFANHKYIEPENYNLQQLMNAADNNDPKALFRFGLLYSKGIAMPLNKTKAARFYQKSASLGYAPAMCNLGKMYLRGYGVKQDKQKALELFQQAASKGDAKALFNIGVLYFKGNGVEQNYKKAIEYYQKASDLYDSDALFALGQMYTTGEGISIDKQKAFELFKQAAKYGHSIAQYNLALMYQNGVDQIVEKDILKCVQMYQKASDRGLPEAQLNLALLYLKGDTGFQINKEKAAQLFEKAANQGNEEAKLYLELILSNEGNENAFKIEKITQSLDKKIESMHNNLFSSFYSDFVSTLSYISDIFVDQILSEFLSKAEEINDDLKKISEDSILLISKESRFPLIDNSFTMSFDPINDEIDEINRLKVELQRIEKELSRVEKQLNFQDGNDSE